MTPTAASQSLQDSDYRRLLAFRSELRAFTRWSEESARTAGLTPALHQLLLVVRGHISEQGPTISDAADALHIRHHSAVELAQRAETRALRLMPWLLGKPLIEHRAREANMAAYSPARQ